MTNPDPPTPDAEGRLTMEEWAESSEWARRERKELVRNLAELGSMSEACMKAYKVGRYTGFCWGATLATIVCTILLEVVL